MPDHEATFIRLQNELVDNLACLFVFVEHPEVEPTNNRSERNVRREAEIRKGGRTSKTPKGAKRRGVTMTVLASLRTRFGKFTLASLLAEVKRWLAEGQSIFESELNELQRANAPPSVHMAIPHGHLRQPRGETQPHHPLRGVRARKCSATNRDLGASALVAYHGGRGSQEGVFGELKTQCQMDYIPVRRRCGNETYLLASLFAFNLIRDLQMQLAPPTRTTTRKRPTLWAFEQVATFRRTILQRAGRLSTPSGKLVLTFCAGKKLKRRVLHILQVLAA